MQTREKGINNNMDDAGIDGKQRIMGDRQTEGSEVAQSPNRSQKPPFPFPGHLQGHRRCEKERERFTERARQELLPVSSG